MSSKPEHVVLPSGEVVELWQNWSAEWIAKDIRNNQVVVDQGDTKPTPEHIQFDLDRWRQK